MKNMTVYRIKYPVGNIASPQSYTNVILNLNVSSYQTKLYILDCLARVLGKCPHTVER